MGKYELQIKPYLHKIPEWYQRMDEGQMANMLGVGRTSWAKYKKKYPEFAQCFAQGKLELVDQLYSALKRKALGFHEITKRDVIINDEVVTLENDTYYPPDLGSIHLLLKNLDEKWHNDDQTTIELRRAELKIKQERAEKEDW